MVPLGLEARRAGGPAIPGSSAVNCRAPASPTCRKPWRRICARAGLSDVRIHYSSRALALGESPPMIGRLLGHTQVETTARYAHLAQDSVRESAMRVSERIAAKFLRD